MNLNKKFKYKVLLIISSDNVGGVEKRFFNLMRYIYNEDTNNNFQYTFLFHRRFLKKLGVSTIEFIDSHNVKLITYGSIVRTKSTLIDKRISQIQLFLKLLSVKLTNNYRSVHFVTSFSLKFKRIFGSTNKVSTFYNGGSTAIGVRSQSFKSTALDKSILIDCLSDDIKKEILNIYPTIETRLFVSPCSFIDYENTDFSVKEKENIIVFSGRFNEQKGVNLLISIIPDFLKKTKDFKLYILGHGPLENLIKETVRKHNGQDRIKIEFNTDPKLILKKSKIFLSLQKNENYPSQSLIEAMACGNIPIATDNGLTHLLVNENTGIRVQEDSSTDLFENLLDLCSNIDNMHAQMASNRLYVQTKHSAIKYLNYLNKLYLKK